MQDSEDACSQAGATAPTIPIMQARSEPKEGVGGRSYECQSLRPAISIQLKSPQTAARQLCNAQRGSRGEVRIERVGCSKELPSFCASRATRKPPSVISRSSNNCWRMRLPVVTTS